MKTKSNAFFFRLTPEELKEQVEDYSTLKFSKSARGQCVLFFIILNIFTLLVTFFINIADVSFFQALCEVIIFYWPLLFFVYKGHRWAVIGLLLIWVLDKAYGIYYQLNTGGSIIGSLFFLLIGVGICMKTLQVENAKKKVI